MGGEGIALRPSRADPVCSRCGAHRHEEGHWRSILWLPLHAGRGNGRVDRAVAGDVRKLSEGDETTRATRNMIEMLGYMNGLTPTPFSGQMAATVQFLVDWSSGEVEPAGAGEVWEGVRSGRITE